MALNRVGSFISNYNAYNIPPAADDIRIDSGIPANRQQPLESDVPKEAEQPKALDLEISDSRSRGNASIENVAISFGTYDSSSIEMLGERGLASEDMKNAIIGMRKDHILHEYQYFVGGKVFEGKDSNIIVNDEDGVVVKH